MTTKEKLARLNELNARLGKPAMKAWKQTTAKLDEAIRVAEAAVAELKEPKSILPRIAKELGLDPKKARAKLRKAHGYDWKKMNEDELRKELA